MNREAMKIGAFRRVGAVGRRFAALENAEKEARLRTGELSHWLCRGAGKNALRNDKPPGDASGVVK
jgi:hypothetical protein